MDSSEMDVKIDSLQQTHIFVFQLSLARSLSRLAPTRLAIVQITEKVLGG